jgi:predicted Zn-dependent peptidase
VDNFIASGQNNIRALHADTSPEHLSFALPNGIHAHLISTLPNGQTSSMSPFSVKLVIHSGYAQLPTDLGQIAHLAEEFLVRKHLQPLVSSGFSPFAATHANSTTYSLKGIADDHSKILDAIACLLDSRNCSETTNVSNHSILVESLTQAAKELDLQQKDPYKTFLVWAEAKFFNRTPPFTLPEIDPPELMKSIEKFILTHYTPSRADIYVAGPFATQQLNTMVTDAFSLISNYQATHGESTVPQVHEKSTLGIYLSYASHTATDQEYISMRFPVKQFITGPRDYISLLAFAFIMQSNLNELSGGAWSHEVMTQNGDTYISWNASLPTSKLPIATLADRIEQATISDVHQFLSSLQEESWKSILDFFKRSIFQPFFAEIQSDDNFDRIEWIALSNSLFGRIVLPTEMVACVERLTLRDLQNFSHRIRGRCAKATNSRIDLTCELTQCSPHVPEI